MPPRDITALAGHAPHQQAHQRDIPPLHQLIEPLAVALIAGSPDRERPQTALVTKLLA
jgi:hypothetical protein